MDTDVSVWWDEATTTWRYKILYTDDGKSHEVTGPTSDLLPDLDEHDPNEDRDTMEALIGGLTHTVAPDWD